jgi:L-alanine-DL-glutamate epimerase-like enolase superfamily enzyme
MRSWRTLRESQKFFERLESLELGVLQYWRLHASACAPNCVLASHLESEWVRERFLVIPRMQYETGCAILPDFPGLVDILDHEALPSFTRTYWEV